MQMLSFASHESAAGVPHLSTISQQSSNHFGKEITLYKKALGLDPAKTLTLPELEKLVTLREGADDMFSSSHARGVALQAQLANVKILITKAADEGENAIVVRKSSCSVHFVNRMRGLGYIVSEHNSTNMRISWLQECE